MRKFVYESGRLNGGLNNKRDEVDILNNQLSDVQNIVFDAKNNPEKRPPIFTNTATGQQWKTGITEGSPTPAAVSVETAYTYRKNTGAKYFIVFAGTEVRYSTNLKTWVSLNPTGVSFSTTNKMRFETFKDKLIMCNGSDDVYYWDGAMSSAIKIGAPYLATTGSGTTVDNGVHKVLVTYEAASGTPAYKYGVFNSIVVTGNDDFTITNIPDGPIDRKANSRKVWITAANGSTYYLWNNDYIADTVTSITFNIADSTLTGSGWATYTDGNFTSVKVPPARFPAVYENTLFLAHGNATPSEYYWSEAGSFEDFPTANMAAINADDGDYITGLKTYKAANQLLAWKRTGLYGIFPASDTYIPKSLSTIGCTFADSIYEFHIADEFGERDTMVYGNPDGIWEYAGSAVRSVSEQPSGSSIQKAWEETKQREMQFQKNIIASQANWGDAAFPTNSSAVNNFGAVVSGALTITDVFDFKDSNISRDLQAWCWCSKDKAIYAVVNNGTQGDAYKYTWNSALLRWDETDLTTGTIVAHNTVKMKYDSNTDRIYAITADGYIYRSTITRTTNDFFADVKTYTTDSQAGGTTNISVVRQLNDTVLGRYFNNYYSGNIRYQYSSSVTVNITSHAYTAANYFLVTKRASVTNNHASTNIYYKKGQYITFTQTGFTADGIINHGTSTILDPGLYCLMSTSGSFSATDLSYTNIACNSDFEIIRFGSTDYMFYTDNAIESFGGFLPKNSTYYINLSTWGTQTLQYLDSSRGLMYYTTYNGVLYFSQTVVTTSGFYNIIEKVTSLTSITSLFNTTAYNIRKIAYNGTHFAFQVYKESDGGQYLGRMTGETGTPEYETIGVTLDDTATYSVPLLANPDGKHFYYVASNGTIYEWNPATDTPVSLGIQAAQTDVNIFGIANGIADYVPTQLFVQYDSETTAYWHGIWGNYQLRCHWLKTGSSSIDAGANSKQLLSIEALENRGADDSIDYYIYATAATDTTTPQVTNIFYNADLGESILDGKTLVFPGGGEGALTLLGDNRYIHLYIIITYNVAQSLDATTGYTAPTVDNFVTNWIDVEGGTTIPKTEVSAFVYDNKYYLAAVEAKPKDTSVYAEDTNNVIFVLDRYKRWTIWRGRGCHAASFTEFDNVLYWGDCFITSAGAASDYIVALGTKGKQGLADTNISTGEPEAIDAYITTKTFMQLADYDNPRFKKKLRHIFITSQKFVSSSAYNLTFEYRGDEDKYTESDGTNNVGDDKWTTKTISVADALNTGKTNGRLDFANEQPKKRWQFRFRNNTIGQDIGFIEFTLEGFIYHARD